MVVDFFWFRGFVIHLFYSVMHHQYVTSHDNFAVQYTANSLSNMTNMPAMLSDASGLCSHKLEQSEH